MYVSRLVYFMALLEAVLWIQPNFALSWQRDMTKLLQTQTDNLGQLVQNVAKENVGVGFFQKQLEMIAREQEMAARANEQLRNMRDTLQDKGTAKQAANANPTQHLPQFLAGANDGGDKGGAIAVGDVNGKHGEANGAVPLFSSSQAYAVACCVLIACVTAFSNEMNSVPESSDSEESSAIPSPVDESLMKRPRDSDEAAAESDCDESCTTNADVKRERKRARLGMHVTSDVHLSQAKRKNNHKRHTKNETNLRRSSNSPCSPCFNTSEVASDDSIMCSPNSTLSSGAESPVSVTYASCGAFSTLPPEMANDFEAEHAFYFHGISCPNSSSNSVMQCPVTPMHTTYNVPVISASPSLETPVYASVIDGSQHVTAIDPAILMEPTSPRLSQEDNNFTTNNVSTSDHSSEADEENDECQPPPSVVTNAPMFGVTIEPLVHDMIYC